jgi:hypothetical protein
VAKRPPAKQPFVISLVRYRSDDTRNDCDAPMWRVGGTLGRGWAGWHRAGR